MKKIEKISALLTALLFCLLLFGMGLWTVLSPDPTLVVSERRRVTPFPHSLTEAAELEGYFSDTLPPREALRHLRRDILTYGFGFWLVDGYYLTENGIAADLSPENLPLAHQNAAFLESLAARYFGNHPVHYALAPDKGIFSEDGLTLDYAALEATLSHNEGYIPLAHTLTPESYYATDIHWRQESLFPVATALADKIGFAPPCPESFETLTLGSFTGTLALQTGLSRYTDQMTILLPAASVTVQYADGMEGALYDLSLFHDSLDPYDLYLRGETVGGRGNFHVRVENQDNQSGRRLILFRDSFARSLAPLLIHAYSEIILVDLRAPFYQGGSWEADLYANEKTDILFLVSTHTYNTTRFH